MTKQKFKIKILVLSLFLIFFVLILFYNDNDDDSDSLLIKYEWKEEYSHLNGPDISPTDPLVINKLKSNYLQPPSTLPYNLTNIALDPSMGQSNIIKQLFGKRKGFYVECGALDGETRSNTLSLEVDLGWDGLLIEADPDNYSKLKEKNRKAWSSNTCLSVHPWPMMASFLQSFNQGKITSNSPGYIHPLHKTIQCFPLSTYLLALNITKIDYLSLDVEGLELEILKTIDFERFDISTLSVEFIHGKDGKDSMKSFMEEKGYFVHSEVTNVDWLANDFIFVKRSFV